MEERGVGSEVMCTARFGKQSGEGKALLETSELIFRGPFRLKIPFAQMQSVRAEDGELRVEFAKGKAAFALGAQAEKWAHRILHPKAWVEKLGVKPGAKVSVIGALEDGFEHELEEITKAVTRGKVAANTEWIFLCAESRKDLMQGAKIAKSLKGAAALWIVYPKGRNEVTETDVISTGCNAGLKDVKVVGFSPTHTALKFVVPLERR
jgi:hypothetical protein